MVVETFDHPPFGIQPLQPALTGADPQRALPVDEEHHLPAFDVSAEPRPADTSAATVVRDDRPEPLVTYKAERGGPLAFTDPAEAVTAVLLAASRRVERPSADEAYVDLTPDGPLLISPTPGRLHTWRYSHWMWVKDELWAYAEVEKAIRDRMAERFDMVRVVRDKKFQYHRNFYPHLPWSQFTSYTEEMPTMQLWRRLHEQGRLNATQNTKASCLSGGESASPVAASQRARAAAPPGSSRGSSAPPVRMTIGRPTAAI